MADQKRLSLQAGYLVCANNLRKEAKLCDIILYVQGRYGTMVGYPAHKLLLISASKYFKLLFEREDLRNYCHFPHLSEEGLLAVLDIIYGREIRKETNLDDAIMVARFLQVDCAVDDLEKRKESANVSPFPESPSSGKSPSSGSLKRKADIHEAPSRRPSQQHSSPIAQNFKRRIKNRQDSEHSESDHSVINTQQFYNINSPYEQSEADTASNQDVLDRPSVDQLENVPIKSEPDVDLTLDDTEQPEHDLTQVSFTQGGPLFPGQLDQQFVPLHTTDDQNLSHHGSFQAGNLNQHVRAFGNFTGSEVGKSDNSFVENSQNTSLSGQQPADMVLLVNNKHGFSHQIFNPGQIDIEAMIQEGFNPGQQDSDGNWNCEVCGEKFVDLRFKIRHYRVHSEVRPWVCKVCGKAFKLKDHLRAHRVVHTGEKPFACKFCGQLFSQASNMFAHKKKCSLRQEST